MFFKIFHTGVLGSILMAFTYGCHSTDAAPRYKIGFSQCSEDAWRDVMNAEMYRELDFHPELDFEMRVSDVDSEKQIEHIQELVSSGVDILIVAPNESKPLTPVIEEVYRAGIPVILIDRKIESEAYTAYIGADNYNIGETAGAYIIDRFKGKGKIIELQMMMTISPAFERHHGFRDAIAKAPGMEVVEAIEIKREHNRLHSLLPPILQRHPDANIIFAHTDLLAETAYKVTEKYRKADDMFFLGIDGIPGTGQGIQAVEDGILDASLLYPTGGGEAIQLAKAILNKLPFEKKNLLETIVINPSNARILHNQMKRMSTLQEGIDEKVEMLEDWEDIYRNQRVFIFILSSTLLLAFLLGVFLWKSLRAKQAAYKSLEIKNQEIIEHEKQLMKMSEEVKSATQAKVDFFTNISHEFRTPLTLILGFAEDLLPSKKISREIQQGIRHIQHNAVRLLRLVNQLMDFRKTESGKMQLKASENDLVVFVRDTMESYGKTAQKRNIDFCLNTRQEKLMVWFDMDMLDKVLFNLLSNAFKFTPDGGKIHLTLSVDHFENRVKILVEDSGKGITESEAKHVFDPFFQGEEQGSAGTGIGLSLSKALVELHGGEITLQSEKEKGSRFIVALPLGKAHLENGQILADAKFTNLYRGLYLGTEEETFEEDEGTGNASANHHILVIEDNEEVQSFLSKKLGSAYQVSTAANGEEGIQKAFETTPDLIVCDVMMPGKNGFEVTQTLKSDLRTSHIPIIILSARDSIQYQIEGTELGAEAYLTKPFNIHFLRAKIKSLLANRAALKESYSQSMVTVPTSLQEPDLPKETNPLDRDFVRNFMRYIEKHHARQDFQVADLSKEFGLSRSQLYRKVTALLGESISDYIQNVRLKKAEELLLDGKLSVAEVAYSVGYSSPDYFSTVFRSRYGVSPSSFKKNQ